MNPATLLRFLLLPAALLFGSATPALSGVELVSVVNRESRSAGGDSTSPWVSGDGRRVAFQSTAANLVTNDLNRSTRDVFVLDRSTGITRLVTVTRNGAGGDGASEVAGFSRDGRRVLVVSEASNFVDGDDNESSDVFLFDLELGTVDLVSVTADGHSGNGASYGGLLSEDGQHVVFESEADDLVAGDTNRVVDVYRWNLETRVVERVSRPSSDPALAARASGESEAQLVSADGATVVFQSLAVNLAPPLPLEGAPRPLTNDLYFLRGPAATNATVPGFLVISNRTTGRIAARGRGHGLSADGRYLLCSLETDARGFILGGLVRVDLATGATLEVGERWREIALPSMQDSVDPMISADGERVIFELPERDPETGAPGLPVVLRWEAALGQVTRLTEPGPVDTRDGQVRIRDRYGLLFGSSRDRETVVFAATLEIEGQGIATDQLLVRHLPTGTTRWISRGPGGRPVDATPLPNVQVSDDGRVVVFNASTEALVENDLNRSWDVFQYDWESDQVSLVSAHAPQAPSRSGHGIVLVSPQAASADGRFVAFSSSAPGYAPVVNPESSPQAVRRDRGTGAMTLLSVSVDGTTEGNRGTSAPSLSADGAFAVFASLATNLVTTDTNGASDIFLRDLPQGRTVLVSARPDGYAANAASTGPMISPDGRWVAFDSVASDLSPLDPDPRTPDVYLWERATGSLILASLNAAGLHAAAGASGKPVFSPDSQWLVFESQARNLVTGAVPSGRQVYLRHLATGQTRRLAPAVPDLTVYPGPTPVAVFSPDTTHLAFLSGLGGESGFALHLVDLGGGLPQQVATRAREVSMDRGAQRLAYIKGGDRATVPAQVVVLARSTGEETVVSRNAGGQMGNGPSEAVRISPEGRWVTFQSEADNLVPGDENGWTDVFVKDLIGGELSRVGGDSITQLESMSADGQLLVLSGFSEDLVGQDYNQNPDVFAFALGTGVERPMVESVQRVGDGVLEIAWRSAPGSNEGLEESDGVGVTWRSVGGDPVLGADGGIIRVRVPIPAGDGVRFYRVVRR